VIQVFQVLLDAADGDLDGAAGLLHSSDSLRDFEPPDGDLLYVFFAELSWQLATQ
jgi:hypothetical protein